MADDTFPRLLRLPVVLSLTGLSRTRLYELERAGQFPARRRISARCCAWRADQVSSWIESRPVANEREDAA